MAVLLVFNTWIVLILTSCIIDPVGVGDGIEKPPGENFIHIDYEASDESPKLQLSTNGGVSWATLNEKGTVIISLSTSTSTEILQVIDDSDYIGIFWYCDSATELTASQGVTGANSEKLVIIAGTAPFTAAKTYQMAVVGTKAGQRFGTSVFIKVVN